MNKIIRVFISVLLIFAMTMQLGIAFAEDTSKVGAICYESTENEDGSVTVKSTVSLRGLPKEAKLVTAVYEGNNVVEAKASEMAEDTADAYLAVTVTKPAAEGYTVKSFIWTADGKNSPFAAKSQMGYEAKAEDVELYFDGVDFETAAGEALSFDKTEYIVNLKADENDEINLPKVTYKVKDNSIDVDIVTDAEGKKSVITIESGERIATANVYNSSTAGKSATNYQYTKPYSKTITVSYEASGEAGYLYKDMFGSKSADRVFTGVSGHNGNRNTTLYDYAIEYKLDDTKEFDMVTLYASGFSKQYSLIVVEPLEDTTVDAVVYSDGSALQWQNDTGVISDYAYVSQDAEAKRLEAYDTSKITYAQMSKTFGQTAASSAYNAAGQPVEVTFSGSDSSATYTDSTVNYAVCKSLQASDDHFITGSRAQWARNPIAMQIEFNKADSALLGYNYIVLDANVTYTDATISFYVNQDVKIHFITEKKTPVVKTLDSEGKDLTVGTAVKSAEWMRRYQNNMDVLSLAYYAAMDIMGEGDFVSYNAGLAHLKQNATIDGVKYVYQNPSGLIRKYINADNVIDNIASTGMYVKPQYFEAAGITAATADDGSVTVAGKSFADWLSIIKNVEWTDYPELVTDISWPAETVLYNGEPVVYRSDLLPVATSFNLDENKSVFSDRLGAKQARLTGMIHTYPEALDLEDAVFITTAIKLDDGGSSGTTADDLYIGVEGAELYQYKVNRDCEVMVISQEAHPVLDADATWTKHTADSIKYIYLDSDSSVRTFDVVYTKEFKADDTVTMYTPGKTGVSFVNFVKELDR